MGTETRSPPVIHATIRCRHTMVPFKRGALIDLFATLLLAVTFSSLYRNDVRRSPRPSRRVHRLGDVKFSLNLRCGIG